MIATPHGRLPTVIFFTTCFVAKIHERDVVGRPVRGVGRLAIRHHRDAPRPLADLEGPVGAFFAGSIKNRWPNDPLVT